MSTKLDRLRATFADAYESWGIEQRRFPPLGKNAISESAWSVQVVEPVLAALDWPLLDRTAPGKTGAYFEWPTKNCFDVGLLVEGIPRAVVELKASPTTRRADCEEVLRSRFDGVESGKCSDWALQKARQARYAVAAWSASNKRSADCGFSVYRVERGRLGLPHAPVFLGGTEVSSLARLAEPVLAGRMDVEAWLISPALQGSAARPRFVPRERQAKFFDLLAKRLGLCKQLPVRHRCLTDDPPRPTFAYADLSEVLRPGWGLVFGIDPTVNDLQCSFFRDCNTEVENVGRWPFGTGGIDDSTLTAFLEQRVLPKVEQWKAEAVALGRRGADA